MLQGDSATTSGKGGSIKTVKLYPHQRVGAEFLVRGQRVLLADEMGVGKTVTTIAAIGALHELGFKPFPICVIAPNSMKSTWADEFAAWYPDVETYVISSGKNKKKVFREALDAAEDGAPAVVIINWEAVRLHSRLAPYGSVRLKRCEAHGGTEEKESRCEVHEKELNLIPFRTVVADECFVAGTRISTPDGGRRIEDLRPGDRVWGYDHDTDEIVESIILASGSRPAAAIVEEWGVTPNHPVYVEGSGYRPIGDLQGNEVFYGIQDSRVPGVWPTIRTVRFEDRQECATSDMQSVVRRPPSEKTWPTGATTITTPMRELREVVHTEEASDSILHEVVRYTPSDDGSGTSSGVSREHASSSTGSKLSRDHPASYAWTKQPGPYHTEGDLVASREAWLAEWTTWQESDEQPRAASTLRTSLRRLIRASSVRLRRRSTAVLRHRYRTRGVDDRDRGRWLDARFAVADRVRPTPYGTADHDGLVRHPVQPVRDPERYLEVCARSARNDLPTVHSLTTTTGNYFANGILVKNCHKQKDPKSKQTRASWAVQHRAAYRFSLTGTPLANHPGDVWPIMHGIRPDDYPTKTRYTERFCLQSWNPFGGLDIVGVRPDTREEYFKILDPAMRRMPKTLVLRQLPPKVRVVRHAEMKPKQKKAYTQIAEGMITQLESGRLVVATNNLTKQLRLIQFSSSYAEADEFGHVTLDEPSNKIDALTEVLDELGDKPVVVAAESRQLIELACARLDKLGVSWRAITGGQNETQRAASISDFQEGHARVVLFTIKAGGVGLTLTRADTIVFLQRSWSMLENKQAEDRVHRIGSEDHESVEIIDLVAPGTVEEDQILRLYEKAERLEEIVRDRERLSAAVSQGDEAARYRLAEIEAEETTILSSDLTGCEHIPSHEYEETG